MKRAVRSLGVIGLTVVLVVGSIPTAAIAGTSNQPDGVLPAVVGDAAGGQVEAAPGEAVGNGDSGALGGLRSKQEISYIEELYVERWIDSGGVIDVQLPSTVNMVYADGTRRGAAVEWIECMSAQGENKAQLSEPVLRSVGFGCYVCTGKVEGVDIPARCNVTVMERSSQDVADSIVSYEPISYTILTSAVGDNKPEEMIGSAKITLADGRIEYCNVAWDSIPRNKYDDDDDEGSFVLKGHIERYGNYEVEATINVAVPHSQNWDISLAVETGGVPKLPSVAMILFSNTDMHEVPVTWDPIDSEKFSKPGSVEVWGSIPASSLRVKAMVKVAKIVKCEFPRKDDTIVGVAPSPNPQCYVTFDDGKTESLNIAWDSVDPSAYAQPGTIEITGSVTGSDYRVTKTVRVLDHFEGKELGARELVGFTHEASTFEEIEVIPGETRMFYVHWNEEDVAPERFQRVGDYVLHGSIDGSPVKVEKHLHVVELERIGKICDVKTMEGVAPQLQYMVRVEYSDGATEDKIINWDPVDQSQYAEEGVFTVQGTVGRQQSYLGMVRCKVIVLDVQEPKRIEISNIVGKTPFLPYTVDATLWDGTIVTASVNWENLSSGDFSRPGTTKVRGHLSGSNKEIIATVRTHGVKFNQKTEVWCHAHEGLELPGTLHDSVVLNNGEETYLDSVAWDSLPVDLRAGKPGDYEVTGRVNGTQNRIKVIVRSRKITKAWLNSSVFIPKGAELTIPGVVNGETSDDGFVWDMPVAWEPYDSHPQESFIAIGHIAGSDIVIKEKITVLDKPAFRLDPLYLEKGYDGSKALPTQLSQLVNIDGDLEESNMTCGVTWDTRGVDWSKPGVVKGVAHATQMGFAEDCPVEIEYGPNEGTNIKKPADIWVRPGVMPSPRGWVEGTLPSGAAFSSGVEWEQTYPSQYDKAGKTFEVNGVVVKTGTKVTTAVHVANIMGYDLPKVVTVASHVKYGVPRGLPLECDVHWSDGGTTREMVTWYGLPRRNEAFEAPVGSTVQLKGCIYFPSGGLRIPVSIKAKIASAKKVYDNGEFDVVTHVGEMPALPDSVASLMSDDTISKADVVWEPISPEKYEKPGVFEVVGKLKGCGSSFEGAAERTEFSFFRIPVHGSAVGSDGTVRATVTVRAKGDSLQANQPEVQIVNIPFGSDATGAMPSMVEVRFSGSDQGANGSSAAFHAVDWDLSKVRTDKTGTYRVVGKINGVPDRDAVAYINVLPAKPGVEKAVPFELTVRSGTAPSAVDRAMPIVVSARCTDGTVADTGVEAWDLMPVNVGSLGKVGDIKVEGRLFGSTVPACAIIHVVDADGVTSVTISGAGVAGGRASLGLGESLLLSALVQPVGFGPDVVWSSSDSTVATVDEAGVVVAAGKGAATIRATSVENPDVFAEVEVTVGDADGGSGEAPGEGGGNSGMDVPEQKPGEDGEVPDGSVVPDDTPMRPGEDESGSGSGSIGSGGAQDSASGAADGAGQTQGSGRQEQGAGSLAKTGDGATAASIIGVMGTFALTGGFLGYRRRRG